MKKKPLGNSGLSVAPLALGAMCSAGRSMRRNRSKCSTRLSTLGFDLIDTANVYSVWKPGNQGGESEAIIGKWLKSSGKRDKVLVATKVGMKMSESSQGLKRDYILRSAEESLQRLQIDHIDLYQSHKDDPETPLEETLAAYDTLIKQGKVARSELRTTTPRG